MVPRGARFVSDYTTVYAGTRSLGHCPGSHGAKASSSIRATRLRDWSRKGGARVQQGATLLAKIPSHLLALPQTVLYWHGDNTHHA